jgi:hypothetical protein
MTNQTEKIKKAVLGLIAGAAIAANVYASNPADLTSSYRQIDVPYLKACISNTSNWIFASKPFGKNNKNNASILGMNTPSGNSADFVVSNNSNLGKGLSLDSALEVYAPENHNPQSALAIDITNKYGGIGALINSQNAEYGARLNYKDITAFARTSELYGITAKTSKGNFEASYAPNSKKVNVIVSKSFKIKSGTLFPEFKLGGSDKISSYGFAIGYIPREGK